MKVVLQRVKKAKVIINEKINGEIDKGYLILLGIGKEDTEEIALNMVEKIAKLRLFEDENGKTNLSIKQVDGNLLDVEGNLLAISQFTLYANSKKGTRPSFVDAAAPDIAIPLYEYFLKCCELVFGSVQHGEFGADMQVELINDGPFTIVLDSNNT